MEDSYIYYLIHIFFIFSVAGWLMEVILKYFQYHRFINRGFLIGPYCPIYGFGAVLVTSSLDLISIQEASIATSFLVSFFLCGALEYMTSFVLEKRFHARWWDYSQKPMNLYGRVWIGNLILFGLGGVMIYDVLDPRLLNFFSKLTPEEARFFSWAIVLVIFVDFVVSHFIIQLLKEGVEKSQADSSEAIAKEVRYLLENKSVLHRRIMDAYPEISFRTDRVKRRLDKVKQDTERLRALANDKMFEISDLIDEREDNLAKNLISTRNLQRGIIDIQDEIINELLKGGEDQEEMVKLFNELEAKRQILDKRDQRLLSR